ncbi:aminoacyl-histidine dipeptidase [uncultured Maribacter sp.]|uniref:aminoacyl-histidine dipeptidase n=1 Tax=uncultured Maribacter sp. TaxID=431308 RepID=UPI00260B1B7B|nr:aminoacyl-histidine dipeptidase [uncultured Maribacter sp.]
MSEEIRELEPVAVWNKFADLNAVPRPSKKEERVINFMLAFGESLNLETLKDEVGNVIIRKPASKGFENKKMITLQSHLDMVHQKNNDTIFDFEEQGIEMFVEEDWVKAKGTTLGADNGLGVATIMALLESKDIEHPALEALFTIDEETGMTGAMGLKEGILKGEILLNLDTEEDDEIGIGCAGGVDITAKRTYSEKSLPRGIIPYKIVVNGLQGGHSGMDIHKGLGNANKIMNRILYTCNRNYSIRISEINGGGLRNAIPRESSTVLIVDKAHASAFEKEIVNLAVILKQEFKLTEPNLNVTFAVVRKPKKVMGLRPQEKLFNAVYAAHNGVYSMSNSMPGLVETSNNIARVTVKKGEVVIACLTRSSVNSSKDDLANALTATFEIAGMDVSLSGDYPGWNPNPDSAILKVLENKYETIFKEKPNVAACHAGLECGILGQNYPKIDMISFGPTIKGAHSPDERVSISSVQKYWKFVLEILKDSPEK